MGKKKHNHKKNDVGKHANTSLNSSTTGKRVGEVPAGSNKGSGVPSQTSKGTTGKSKAAPRHFKTCPIHAGRKKVFELPNGLQVYAAEKHTIDKTEFRTILDCTAWLSSEFPLKVPEGMENLCQYAFKQTIISVDWDDGEDPPLKPEFWYALPDTLIREGKDKLVVVCMGAHGRTGTALASLAIVGLGLTVPEAVHMVRRKHCDNAVESFAQMDYLEDVEIWARENGFVEASKSDDLTYPRPSDLFRFLDDDFDDVIDPRQYSGQPNQYKGQSK